MSNLTSLELYEKMRSDAGLVTNAAAILDNRGFSGHPIDAYRYFVGDGIDLLVKKTFPVEAWSGGSLDFLIEEVKKRALLITR